MEAFTVSYPGAVLGGLLSFFSPCVLPLVPAYLCFLGGVSMEQLATQGQRDPAIDRRVLVSAAVFVLGFSTVFVTLGATASAFGQLLAQNMDWLGKVAGVVIVIFGLHYAGLLRLRFLNFEKRFQPEARAGGLVASYVLGLAFAFGWTPCVGPILATILMLAAAEENVAAGMVMLGFYAAGIGVPFLAAAFAARPFMAFMRRFRGHMRKVELTIGALLVITGVLIFQGSLSVIGQWMLETFPGFGMVG